MKKAGTGKRTASTKYDCDEVERYLNRAVKAVKNEMLPKIDTLDKRDREQYEGAKQTMGFMTETLGSLYKRFDEHVTEEALEFKALNKKQEELSKAVKEIQDTLNNVSANGNKGLHASLTDLYNKSREVHDELKEIKSAVTEFKKYIEPSMRWHELGVSAKNVWRSSVMFKIFKTRLGTFIAIVLPIGILAVLVYLFAGPGSQVAAGVIALFGIVLGILKKVVIED